MIRTRLAPWVAGLAACSALALPSTPAGATSTVDLSELLARSWQQILKAPAATGPWSESGDPCLDLGIDDEGRPVVSPTAPLPPSNITCTVPAGTAIFVTGFSSECSTLEPDPYAYGRSWATGMQCARQVDRGIDEVTLTVDGTSVRLREVMTRAFSFTNPVGGLLDPPYGLVDPPADGTAAAHGWVVLLDPLPVGTHTIVIESMGIYGGQQIDYSSTTTLIVT